MAKILLIVSGGIAAYKACEFIRLARRAGHHVTPVLTAGGAEFITPLTLSALAESPVYQDLFSLKDESEMGHIRLSREADLIVVAPASANLISRYAQGKADDLAATVLLASDKPVLLAPAMNPMMWANADVQDNLQRLRNNGVRQVGPDAGDMACGETGSGRLSEPVAILEEAERILGYTKELQGLHAIVTSGPTFEPLDPVRFIGNRSSGKQGHAIAKALHKAGAKVTLIAGPVTLADPDGIDTIHVETADQMHDAVQNALPADIFVGAAAVSDWTAKALPYKHKKEESHAWHLSLHQTVDILGFVSTLPNGKRPKVSIGFALESHEAESYAVQKLIRKKCDALLMNKVLPESTPFGNDRNQISWVDKTGITDWGLASKEEHAFRLANTIATLIIGKI